MTGQRDRQSHATDAVAAEDLFFRLVSRRTFLMTAIACVFIAGAVIFTGVFNYKSSEREIIRKSKNVDMVNVLKAITYKVEGMVTRAEDASQLLASDDSVVKWFRGTVNSRQVKAQALGRLNQIATEFRFSNAFLAGGKTGRYYYHMSSDNGKAEKSAMLSKTETGDRWYYEMLGGKQRMAFNVEYDRAMKDTFLFVNVLVGQINKPIGVAGVGMSLSDISREFSEMHAGISSELWLVDEDNVIQISQKLSHRGFPLNVLLPKDIIARIHDSFGKKPAITILAYRKNGKIMDLGYKRLASTKWVVVYQIPRTDNISVLNSIKTNVVLTIIIVLFSVVLLFFAVSYKLYDPYKQAIMLTKKLEENVRRRTTELVEANALVMDSIQVAKHIQETMLPSVEEMNAAFPEHFVLWMPRDVVGGDFYWMKTVESGHIKVIVVGDCTGHGVPGALMTMAVTAILSNITAVMDCRDPVTILRELDRQMNQAYHQNITKTGIDNGLDIGICCIEENSILRFAGAKMDLYLLGTGVLRMIKGYKREIGSRSGNFGEYGGSIDVLLSEGDTMILTTDGLLHQNGGAQDQPFGVKHFEEAIVRNEGLPLSTVRNEFVLELQNYMGQKKQRDDITLVAFRMK